MTGETAGADGIEDPIVIGRIGKPHGIRGGVHVDGAIDAPALVAGFVVWLNRRRFEIASRGGTDARPILTFVGVEDRNAAEELRGADIVAPRNSLTPLGEGEWYANDLEGLRIVSEQGAELGEVLRMTNAPSVDLLEVRTADGGQLLIPMVRDAVLKIDPLAGAITVDAAFLDLG